ncbi:alkaline shock response membrane anchor protein AmaP [Microvirga roseola]|uniref:alkaline shock response membrane anchor protein AmaP n=1 Tax=Microvirga roseola TaxID=2883126 RepID=UPI001E529FF0|nr:alkaline shock response membrane anchor protein AmaP [Microvirga roseola]
MPSFGKAPRRLLNEALAKVPEPDLPGTVWLDKLRIHLTVAARHPRDVIDPALRSWARMLPLSLTGITTAAVTPTFVMLFTDEFWWVGMHLDPAYVWSAAIAAILVATCLVPLSQRLFFPHREKRVPEQYITEWLADHAIRLRCKF